MSEGSHTLLAQYAAQLQRRTDLSPRSKTLYAAHLFELGSRCEGLGLLPESLAFHHAQRWVAAMHSSGMARSSMALRLSSWRGFYDDLLARRLIAVHPLTDLRLPKAPKPLPKALSVDEAVALANYQGAAGAEQGVAPLHRAKSSETNKREAVQPPELQAWLGVRDACLVELLYGSGLRVAELCSLDLRQGLHSISWLIAEQGSLRLRVQGKRSKVRFVPLAGETARALQRWLALRGGFAVATQFVGSTGNVLPNARAGTTDLGEALEAGPGDNLAVFLNQHGQRLSDAHVRAILKKRGKAAGLAVGVHPHMLRHSYASHLLQATQDLRSVQELMGHASISATQVYTRLDFAHLAKVYDQAHPRQKAKI